MYKKLMIIYLGILAAMAPLATDMYLPSLPELQADFGSSTALIQLTLTMTTLGMAAGQIFAGPISDLRGRKVPLLVGMLIFMAAVTLVKQHEFSRQLIFIFPRGSPDTGPGRCLRYSYCQSHCQGYVSRGRVDYILCDFDDG